MNRPDYILRKFRFYELVGNPHTLYILDSSNEENAKKIKDYIQQFNNKLNIVYKWVPAGKDYVYQLLPLVKEKYSFHMGDDDFIIPKTITECADFLEDHPDYGTCSGQQVNIRFRKEDYGKPYGIIEKQTRPINRSFEEQDMLTRIKNFWSKSTPFICFAVRRIEVEKTIRNITKHFGLLEDMYEFILLTVLTLSGKYKVLDKLSYVMQISDIRTFNHGLSEELFLFPLAAEQWRIYLEGLSEILVKNGISEKESMTIAKRIFILYLVHQYGTETGWSLTGQKVTTSGRPIQPAGPGKKLFRKLKHFASNKLLLKRIYYKFKPPIYVDRPESKYFEDFKAVKDFLEKGV